MILEAAVFLAGAVLFLLAVLFFLYVFVSANSVFGRGGLSRNNRRWSWNARP